LVRRQIILHIQNISDVMEVISRTTVQGKICAVIMGIGIIP
jgi:hypothetical protein